MACDLAIAADNTRLTLAYSNVGTSCDVSASWSLPRMVGLRRSLEIALLNEVIEAPEALRLGLVNRVVPIAALDQETHAIARRLADGPPIALGNMKSLMRGSFSRDLRQQLDAERLSFGECTATEDFSEALSAFFEKRRANYRGR
jgi:2-(1,2-epoxy-1,2-dihydrophenyl)acetyl-CoA isomerase